MSIGTIKGKTKILEYYNHDFETILNILRNNRNKIEVFNLTSRNAQEGLRGKFQKSIEKIIPLKKKILETDALIDQIVYKLYGLTDEEIAIVEGEE
ncbi:MAG: hypothetical protein M1269_07120 [Chloroflexi bacterium]|nr:hypothetical protein [Chloroflexota bacterium]